MMFEWTTTPGVRACSGHGTKSAAPVDVEPIMQILPATAKSIAQERGLVDFHVDDLRDPPTNINFGAWYLSNQIETFADGDQCCRLDAGFRSTDGPGRGARVLAEFQHIGFNIHGRRL